MPNWTQNSILIPKSLKKKFMWKFTSVIKVNKSPRMSYLDFNRIIKQPNGITSSDTYMWNINNWGTKWGAGDSEFQLINLGEHAGKYEIKFTTANGRPTEKMLILISQRLKCNVEHYFLSEEDDVFGMDSYQYSNDDGEIYISNIEESEELKSALDNHFYGATRRMKEILISLNVA